MAFEEEYGMMCLKSVLTHCNIYEIVKTSELVIGFKIWKI
jgi:hypothetical protein